MLHGRARSLHRCAPVRAGNSPEFAAPGYHPAGGRAANETAARPRPIASVPGAIGPTPNELPPNRAEAEERAGNAKSLVRGDPAREMPRPNSRDTRANLV